MYQALYRKYRPQTFSDVVGQRSITDTLRNQLMTDRLSHAYLFTGTRGTGKTSCAKILAKAVNCLQPQDGNPCNCCAACRAIDSGACMDVLEIDAASNNGVDSVRVLRDDAVYTPGEVRMRVYIIDEVHMLSTAAFNALLKIIEEPPAHLLFILATTELHKVPATILSRCQRFAFRRLTPEEIGARLNYIAYEENIELEPDALSLLSRLADGAMRDGVSLLDQVSSAGSGTVSAQLVYDALGLAGQKRTGELLQAVGRQDCAAALSIFSQLYAGGKDIGAMLGELIALCRDLLICRAAPKSGLSMLSGLATDTQRQQLLSLFSGAELLRCIALLQEAKASCRDNADSRVASELCLMQMCQPELSLDAQAISARLSRLEQQLASGMVIAKPAEPERDAPEEEAPPHDDSDAPPEGAVCAAEPAVQEPAAENAAFWPELSARIQAELPPSIRGFFVPGGPVTPLLRGEALLLGLETDFLLQKIRTPERETMISEKASALLRRPIRAKFVKAQQLQQNSTQLMDNLIELGREYPDIITLR